MELVIDETNELMEKDLNTEEKIHSLTDSIENLTSSSPEKIEKKDECMELKNLKYKTMLMKGVPLKETASSNNLSHLEKFLDNEKTTNQNEQWCKLDKTRKTQKLLAFAKIYQKEKELDEEDTQILVQFFKECLDKKKLARVKDVVYDKVTGEIKEIPGLVHTKKHFTLKNLEKHVSTMKSLTPKKTVKVKSKTSKDRTSVSSKEENGSENQDS
jgi:hypothetical protein